jgi:hypothetical protein
MGDLSGMESGGNAQRTCDECAQLGRCITVDDAYVCEACMAREEAAISAAAVVISKMLFQGEAMMVGGDRRMAAAAVEAYWQSLGTPQTGR